MGNTRVIPSGGWLASSVPPARFDWRVRFQRVLASPLLASGGASTSLEVSLEQARRLFPDNGQAGSHQKVKCAGRFGANRVGLIPLILFSAELQRIGETIEKVAEDRICL
jgi:hypothetical protein